MISIATSGQGLNQLVRLALSPAIRHNYGYQPRTQKTTALAGALYSMAGHDLKFRHAAFPPLISCDLPVN